MSSADTLATTVDAFLGGRIAAVQPVSGHHRAGLDAVLLAAAVNASTSGDVVEIGAGVGVAGMAVAARCPDVRVTLAERDGAASGCASAALAHPENSVFASRVTIATVDALDAAAREAAGLMPGAADVVIINPPFRDPAAGTAPATASRQAAYVLEDGLDPWLRAAASLLRPQGMLALIFDAARLDALLAACVRRFGGLEVLPVAPRRDRPAIRVLIAARKGSRSPLRLLPPLALHGDHGNAFRPEIERILRDGAALSEVHPGWTGIG